jgi:hypothetical protein
MNAPNSILTQPSGQVARNLFLLLGLALAGIVSFSILQRFYLAQELLFFVGLALLLMFVVVNVILLGLFFRRAWRFVVSSVARGGTSLTTEQKTFTESPNNSFVTASPIATEADSRPA